MILVLTMTMLVVVVLSKRGASGRVPLGKFRISGVAKSKIGKPLSGPGGDFDLELVEQRKAMIQKKLNEAEEKVKKVKTRRAERHDRKMRVKDRADKSLSKGFDGSSEDTGEEDDELELPFSLQRDEPESVLKESDASSESEAKEVNPPIQRRRLSSSRSLAKLLATRAKKGEN